MGSFGNRQRRHVITSSPKNLTFNGSKWGTGHMPGQSKQSVKKQKDDSPMRGVLLNLRVVELATNETLEREDGVGRVDDRLPFCGKADKTFTVLSEATTEGVVQLASAFSMTRAVLPSMTETQEFVVPKSIPTTGPTSTYET